MTNKKYDRIVFVSRILISALCTLYISLAKVLGWPYGEEVGLISAALITFMNSIMEAYSKDYFSDKEIVEREEK